MDGRRGNGRRVVGRSARRRSFGPRLVGGLSLALSSLGLASRVGAMCSMCVVNNRVAVWPWRVGLACGLARRAPRCRPAGHMHVLGGEEYGA
jgi:hypothetical protein